MRLIDADALIDDLKNELVEHRFNGMLGTPPYTGNLIDMIDRLQDESQTPTVDAVPVCRCKDCKHLSVRSGALGVYQCAIHGDYPSCEYFCADGERKGGNK